MLGISAEPLLGPLDMSSVTGISWIAVGGESGPKPRPMEYEWAEYLFNWSRKTGARFFFKQWGDYWPTIAVKAEIEEYKEMPHDS